MSCIEILPSTPINLDFKASRSAPTRLTYPIISATGSTNRKFNLEADITSPFPTSSGQSHSSAGFKKEEDTQSESIFPSLPPLHHGHPSIHIRQGIMNSARLYSEGEIDAEKAFFVCDLQQVYAQHLRWTTCLPEIQPFYAVKCNPDPYVLRLLAAMGTGFDCASNGEISQVLSLGGVDPSRIIFANPCKANSFIRSAAKKGVDMMTFDNTDELYKIARIHPQAKLVVRILTDDTKSLCQLGLKFGAALVNVPSLLSKAKELGLDVIGVSFHVGSGCYDPTVYRDAIRRARSVFDMASNAGYTFNLLDVGGGFEDALFERAAQVLKESIDDFFPDRRGLKIIAEPGRFFVSNAFSLATNIIARRAPFPDVMEADISHGAIHTQQQAPVMYYINDGVYGAFNCILFDHQNVTPYVLSMDGSFHVPVSEPTSFSSVWGPTCDSIDCVTKSTKLPSALQVGDWLGFENMGAYTRCAASQFNGFEVSSVIYTTGGLGGGSEVRRILVQYAEEGNGL